MPSIFASRDSLAIINIEPIGYILENRGDIQNSHDWSRAISYVFSASPGKEVGTNGKFAPPEPACIMEDK